MTSKISKDSIVEYAISTKDCDLIQWAAKKHCLKQGHIDAIMDLVKSNIVPEGLIITCLDFVDFFQSINIINKYKYPFYYINLKNSLSQHKEKKDAAAINRIILKNIMDINSTLARDALQYKYLSSKILNKIVSIFSDWEEDIIYGAIQHPNVSEKTLAKILVKAKRSPYIHSCSTAAIVDCTRLSKAQYESFYNSVIHHGDLYTLARLAANPSIPQSMADELMNHKSLLVQKALCKSPLVTKDFIDKKIKEYKYHSYLKKNVNLTPEQKEIISSTATVKDILE